ncbi:MAG: hypothetical protein ACO3B0_05155, partial [Chitinophagaceae bacterium]
KNKNILYAGSERGFYLSKDAGTTWEPFQRNLPIVPVTDLIIRDNDLIASTAGRAFWILDDLGAIQQYVDASTVKIISPKATYKFGGGNGLPEEKYTAGQNAPEGVILDYFLPAALDSETVKLTISDVDGNVIRTYTNKKDESYSKYPGGPTPLPIIPVAKGHNRFLWDFRVDQVSPDVKGVYVWGTYNGYAVKPGKYKAKLETKNGNAETQITLLPNPNIQATETDWNEQQSILKSIVSNIKEIHTTVNEVRRVKKQLQNQVDVLKEKAGAEKVLSEAKNLLKSIEGWESNVVESRIQNGQDVINWPSKINSEFFNIKGLADVPDPRVTQGIKNRLSDLQNEWNTQKKNLETLRKSILDYNQLYKSQQLDAIIL